MRDAKAGHPHPAHHDAVEASTAAAHDAGLVVTELTTPEEFRTAHRLLMRIWRTDNPPMPVEMMRALSYAGAYVAGGYLDGELAGVAVGFLGSPTPEEPYPHLHSHITGVDPAVQRRQVGFTLKQHQRAWALGRGIETISWTFDPLVRRNAFFNLTKLGARADQYLVDFYGPMEDGINAGQGSDRMLVIWPLASPRAVEAAKGRPVEPDVSEIPADAVVLSEDDSGWPRAAPRGDAYDGPVLLCAVPADIEKIRLADPALARAWRHGVRDALGGALTRGYRVAGMTRSGWYVLEHTGGRP